MLKKILLSRDFGPQSRKQKYLFDTPGILFVAIPLMKRKGKRKKERKKGNEKGREKGEKRERKWKEKGMSREGLV